MTRPRRPTELAARRMVDALHRTDRLDEVSGAVGALALVTGRMVDEAGGSGAKEYALAKLTTAHLGVLLALARLTGPVSGGANDAFDELMVSMRDGHVTEVARVDYFRRHGHNPPWAESPGDRFG